MQTGRRATSRRCEQKAPPKGREYGLCLTFPFSKRKIILNNDERLQSPVHKGKLQTMFGMCSVETFKNEPHILIPRGDVPRCRQSGTRASCQKRKRVCKNP